MDCSVKNKQSTGFTHFAGLSYQCVPSQNNGLHCGDWDRPKFAIHHYLSVSNLIIQAREDDYNIITKLIEQTVHFSVKNIEMNW